ncbi:mitochondrial inner membrane protease subunit 2 [Prorops nasuta]|uniref:mitochondrial inner membrane protease subunit 2 n=1 Tax=Prorops nasuta TaxID=863751 RepID=UPI0034CD86BE
MGIYLFLRGALIGVPIWVTFTNTVGCIKSVDGFSMQPTLNPDLRLQDWRGDIVTVISPRAPDELLIKRVIGLPGDIINTQGYKEKIIQVPKGHCWIEGDHAGQSLDSNNFGPVNLGLITAKATCIVWPPRRWQILETTVPTQRLPLN